MMEFLYTSAVRRVTTGLFNQSLAEAALQAAEFFGLTIMADRIAHWAKESGAEQLATGNTGNSSAAAVPEVVMMATGFCDAFISPKA